ncbi:MAG: isopeptide-forming domain-containing fimbrial protein [Ruminococcaceae bacterium]|nr:isopeptide-forming domain-containing fimbrial protein [Oscillospiraceae bacterium]
MKKTARILLTVVLAVLVLTAMAVPGFAATGSITITNSNDAVSMNGHTYKAYKIFDVTYNADKSVYDYKIAPAFVDYFEDLNLAASLGEDLDARAYSYVSSISGDAALQAFAKDIYGHKGAAAGSVTADNANNAVISGLETGYYLVYDEGNAAPGNNAEKAIANIALTTTDPDATIVLKASVPTIDKKITGVSDAASNAASATGEDAVSATINQHVSFQIDSIVPDLTGYTNYTYKVSDTMSDALIPDQNAKVTIGTDNVTASSTIVYSGQTMTITVPFSVLKTYAKDTPITITYSARVSADANIYPDATGNSNQAELEYSNNVDDLTIKETTPPSEVKIYLFTIDVTKVNDKNEKLAGAKFVLKDSSNNYIPVVLSSGRYKVSDTLAATEANATVISDANGKIYIDGLAEGTYTLTETEAPATYNLLKDPVTVTIAATYDADGNCTAVTGNTKTVVNKAGGLLPSTGGMGTIIFVVSGIVVMLAAVVVLAAKRRKETA